MVIVHKSPDDGSYLEPKHVAGNKLIKNGVLSEWFDIYTCDVVSPTGISRLKFQTYVLAETQVYKAKQN